ncbi:hypothetical protein A7A78_03040 [Aequorivita soesokkakensis]|uniref:Uncharacterized protein n=1 Tax=Aequorivita soesokkakensis TaxID=1385699 RepID=A0A1A9LEX4_9FLAO|nr:hypothetical protein [Aequorivita soesokkakensis]OAD91486.1 hypothetical protein A7A78_03040 [Aequorivita soesokkakensis]
MNFENLKDKMDTEAMCIQEIPQNLKGLKRTQLPLQRVRRNLRNEILTQIIVFLCLFAIPSFLEINKVAKGFYFILLFITTLITITYLLKMSEFLKRSVAISTSSKQVLINIIQELNLTLEVYKTAIISGSLLLPLIAFVVYTGKVNFEDSLLFDIITFNISFITLIGYLIGYLVVSILIVFITNWWTNIHYGKYVKTMEKTLGEINAE